MKDDRKYAWVAAAAAFLLILGAVWFASSLGGGTRGNADTPAGTGQGVGDRVYTERIPADRAEAPVATVQVAPVGSANPVVTGLGTAPRTLKPQPKPQTVTPRDMFPMGDITMGMPRVSHPYRQIAELFPSFEYEGRLWSPTGKYVRAYEVDLVPTGYQLATEQKLYAIANTSAPDAVLFVRSALNPDKFAVYRRI